MNTSSQRSEKQLWHIAFPQVSDITDPVWFEVMREAKQVVIPARTMVIRKGAPCDGLLLLYKGTICVRQVSEKGREIVLYRIGPGDISILALASLVDGCQYPAEAIAETEVAGFSIPIPLFQKALDGSKDFRNYILSIMAKRLRELIMLVEDIAFERLDARLAQLLSKLFKEKDTSSLGITHEALAVELGTTREVISRLLKDIEKKKGCVKLHRGRIELVSPACLDKCAEKGCH